MTHDSRFLVLFPRSTIPDWFNRCEENSDENLFEIDVSPLTNLDEISGIALYFIFGPTFIDDEIHKLRGIHVQYGVMYRPSFYLASLLMGQFHVWLMYIATYHIECSGHLRVYNDSNSMIIKSCRFHLVYKHE